MSLTIRPSEYKCDLCGKFRRYGDVVEVGGENDETWNECKDCMSESSFETYFPTKREEIGE